METIAVADTPVHDIADLRRALSVFLTGVTIVTTTDDEGLPRGITANSFTSVSLEPPLVLVCINRSAASHAAFVNSPGFGVHILGHDQQALAARFATKSPEKFSGLTCRAGRSGAPMLPSCMAWLDCETQHRLVAGSHLVLFGLVREFGVHPRRPLGYCQGRYLSLAPEQGLGVYRSSQVMAGWIAETADGRILLERLRAGTGWSIPCSSLAGVPLEDECLAAAAHRALGVGVAIQFLYSLYDISTDGRVLIVYRVRLDDSAAGAESAGRKLFPVDSLPWSRIPEPHTAGMLRRYVAERSGARFGLYAGSSERGQVAMLYEGDRGSP